MTLAYPGYFFLLETHNFLLFMQFLGNTLERGCNQDPHQSN